MEADLFLYGVSKAAERRGVDVYNRTGVQKGNQRKKMTASVLRKELQGYIETMPERSLYALKPLLAVLSEPLYTIETDLTSEEIAKIDEGMAEYRKNPSSFVSIDSIQ